MTRQPIVVRGSALYRAVNELSKQSKRCWIASPYLGRGARNILDRTFAAGSDKRILLDIKSGAVDKTELLWLRRLPSIRTKSLRRLHAKLYIFDTGCVITSANFTLNGFERNAEIGLQFSAGAAKPFINVFAKLWSDASKITQAHVESLSDRPKWGPGGAPGQASTRHTEIKQWAPIAASANELPEDHAESGEASEIGAGPTFEATQTFRKRERELIEAELKRRKLSRVGYMNPTESVREARADYHVGWYFDGSRRHDGKVANWQHGARRELCQVRDVFRIHGYAVVAYRTICRYKIDNVVLRWASDLGINKRRPDVADLMEYIRKVRQHERAGRRR